MDLLDMTVRLATEDGHLLQRFDGVWYAYVNIDDLGSEGGPAIVDPSTGVLKPFPTPELAYRACLEAMAGHEMTSDQYRALKKAR